MYSGDLKYYYEVPDVNHKNRTYNFYIDRWEKTLNPNAPSDWRNVAVDYFPLFDLTNKPGPWRFVLSDDDKDYKDFTHRREHAWGENIQTYDMSTGSWSEVFTGFSTHSIQYGSSDDPNRESGVRRITKANANDRMIGGSIIATKSYSGGYFRYEFSLVYY